MFKISACLWQETIITRYRAATHQAARALLAALLLVGYSNAAQSDGFVILETPETGGWPIYAVPDPSLSTSEGEALVFFIRDPACIPLDFNLLLFFATESPVQCPLVLRTKEWWVPEDLVITGGPWGEPFWDPNNPGAVNPSFRNPMQARFEGDAVPVWVVDLADLLATFADGVLTIGELGELQRVEGTATRFHWVQQNSNRASSTPSMRPNHSVTMGSGSLTDGRSFRFHVQERRGEFNHISVVIE